MYKIFIDTNIFLDFYRVNHKDDVKKIVEDLNKYKKYFISTEQSQDEFLRNREKTIADFIGILNQQISSTYQNNFIAMFDIYKDYESNVKETNRAIKLLIEKCKNLIDQLEEDPIYGIYSSIYQEDNVYLRTDEVIEKAIKRKFIGNPPTSNKSSCGDEIIWETLLNYCEDDLIIVSRDKTFQDNYQFLNLEYRKLKNKDLILVDSITKAIELNGEIPSDTFSNIENDLVLEQELLEYGYIQNNSNWINMIYHALIELGGEASLKDLYQKVQELIDTKYPEKANNKAMEATIRSILQRYCSDSNVYSNRMDLFRQIDRGRWALRNTIQKV